MAIVLSGAHRVFFPAAGILAAVAIPLWLVFFAGSGAGPEDPMRWHMHEMLWGYLGAALAGFLFTAIPNWTGRPALKGMPLLALFSLWLLGRVAMFVLPEGMAQTGLTALFGVAVAVLATREIWLGGNKRNLPVAGMTWLFVAAQLLFLAGWNDAGLRGGFGLALMMMALIGGRVTPAFTRNWLKVQRRVSAVPEFGMVDKAALGGSLLAVLAWIALPDWQGTGVLAALAALALLVRVVRWRGWEVAQEPLLVALHLAYLWLPVAWAMLALSLLGGGVNLTQVLHAVGAGAIANMTLVVMIRAILGHGNRPIKGNWLDVILLVSVQLAAVVRIFGAGVEDGVMFYHVAGTLWCLGFGLFVLRYGRIALQPRL